MNSISVSTPTVVYTDNNKCWFLPLVQVRHLSPANNFYRIYSLIDTYDDDDDDNNNNNNTTTIQRQHNDNDDDFSTYGFCFSRDYSRLCRVLQRLPKENFRRLLKHEFLQADYLFCCPITEG